jgi:protein-disulfide isomerase
MGTLHKALVNKIAAEPEKQKLDRQNISLKRPTFDRVRTLCSELTDEVGRNIYADDVINLLFDFYETHGACKKK